MRSISTDNELKIKALSLSAALFSWAQAASAYPEYQEFIEKNSHRTVNCAMCHINEHGPVGTDKGQIASLNQEELAALNQARQAFSPGSNIKSPILNDFGNEIINKVGKKEFLALKKSPAGLASALTERYDLDDDGIPDTQEYLDGTDPLNQFHGDPAKLFWINLQRKQVHLILAVAGVFLLNFGLGHLIKGILILQKKQN